MVNPTQKFGLLSRKVLWGTSLGAALFFMIVGVIFWGGFNTAMEATNTLGFCTSCHEMEQNVYQEYKETVHFTNRSGVRATCSDCHVPDPWVHKVVRKVQASNEILHKILGTVDTPEKFDKERLGLAKKVWAAMKSTDSRECRNCHDFASMKPEDQKKRSRKQHINGMQAGNTCIDCHKGIAHKKVHDQLSDEELTEWEKPIPGNKRPIPPLWQAFIDSQDGGDEAVSEAVEEPSEEKVAAPVESVKTETAAVVTSTTSEVNTAEGIDWSGIEPREVALFYPGQASMEWRS